jgi:ribonuclease HII
MVLAAVALDDASAAALANDGARDSKAFGSSESARCARTRLANLVRQRAAWVSVEVCSVDDIDAYVGRGALNELERERARLLLRRAPPCVRVVADGCRLFSPLQAEFAHLEARDRAEAIHPAVAAASICAKAERDRLFAAIAARYLAEFGALRGGGYVNPPTCAFVAEFVRRHGHLPPEARRSWPWRKLGVPENTGLPTIALPRPRVR